MKCLSLFVVAIVSVAIASNQVEDFCSRWFPFSYSYCVQESSISTAVNENLNTVNDRLLCGDQSVCLSYYLHYQKSYFENNMIMNSDPLPIYSSGTPVNECSVATTIRSYPTLESSSLPDTSNRFVAYRIAAALDLMYIRLKQANPSFDQTLSVDMVKNLMGEDASASDIFVFLRDYGVCTTDDYDVEVAAGRSMNPRCCVYRISSFTALKPRTVCQLAQIVTQRDVYAEMAVNPYSFQLSCSSSTVPVSHSYYRYTIAGVVAGFNTESETKYWKVIVHRHGSNNNIVKAKLEWDHNFGAITGKAFDIEVNATTFQEGLTMTGRACQNRQVPTTQPPAPAEPAAGSGDACGARFWSTLAQGGVLVNMTKNGDLNGSQMKKVTHIFIKQWPSSATMNLDFNTPKLQYVCIDHFVGKTSSPFSVGKLVGNIKAKNLIGLYVGDYALTSNNPGELPVEGRDKYFEILGMPNLEEVIIGRGSFGDYTSFDVEMLPKLKKLQIGLANSYPTHHSDNFYNIREWFDVYNVNPNAEMIIGNYAFHNVNSYKKSELNANTVFGYGTFDQLLVCYKHLISTRISACRHCPSCTSYTPTCLRVAPVPIPPRSDGA